MDKLPSPCISICQIDPSGDYCLGCYRTRAEIASWSRLDLDAQKHLISILQDRRASATGRSRRSRRRVKPS
ncbi:MAG: DUF1289 domain-containing protein [Alphaproteobacteria bacterium]|nr:DUF1289 domain-containing protein [Alphaproteobacteria bacterium]